MADFACKFGVKSRTKLAKTYKKRPSACLGGRFVVLFCVDCDGLTAMGADDCSRCGLLFDGGRQVFVEESLCDDVFW